MFLGLTQFEIKCFIIYGGVIFQRREITEMIPCSITTVLHYVYSICKYMKCSSSYTRGSRIHEIENGSIDSNYSYEYNIFSEYSILV